MYNKILIARLGAIGDVVHTTEICHVLKNYWPDCSIDYLTRPHIGELLTPDPSLNNVISLPEYSYTGFFQLARELSKNKYDYFINLQPSSKTKFFQLFLQAKKTLTYKKFKPSKNQKHIHAVQNFLDTIKPIITDAKPNETLKLYINDQTKEHCSQLLEEQNIKNVIAMVPGVSHNKKGRLWPIENWQNLSKEIINKYNMHIIIIGGEEEQNLARKISIINQDKIHNFCGKLSLKETAGILSLCEIVIGCDTGPTHIASGLSKKVIGLYGLTDPLRTGIFGTNHKSLHGESVCLFCEQKKCKQPLVDNTFTTCMNKLDVDLVLEEINSHKTVVSK